MNNLHQVFGVNVGSSDRSATPSTLRSGGSASLESNLLPNHVGQLTQDLLVAEENGFDLFEIALNPGKTLICFGLARDKRGLVLD